MQTNPGPLARLSPVFWAVFLGVSWTWVIGMFLPVLLVRDYGAWAWVVFALPNVIGAAAVGWVMRDAAASAEFVRRHAAACYGFSAVTIAFHVFFATWMIERVGGRGAGLIALGVSLAAIAAGFLNRLLRGFVASLLSADGRGKEHTGPEGVRRGFDVIVDQEGPDPLPGIEPVAGRDPADSVASLDPAGTPPPGGRVLRWAGAVLVLIVSLIMWNMLYGQGGLAVPRAAPLRGGDPGFTLAYIAPAFLLGFALNPYLDLTFHRARQSTSRAGGRFAFAVGFGVVFFSMIVFTALYARFLAPAVGGTPLSRVMSIYLVVHLVAQSAFTVAAHAGELPMRRGPADAPGHTTLAAAGGVLLFVAAAAVVGWYASTPRLFRGRDLGEVVYWCFLGFYGLVFPGYVWLCALPGRIPASGPTRRALALLAAVVAVAFPMYWMAFVEGRHAWLAPGLLVLLLARALAPRGIAGGASRETMNDRDATARKASTSSTPA